MFIIIYNVYISVGMFDFWFCWRRVSLKNGFGGDDDLSPFHTTSLQRSHKVFLLILQSLIIRTPSLMGPLTTLTTNQIRSSPSMNTPKQVSRQCSTTSRLHIITSRSVVFPQIPLLYLSYESFIIFLYAFVSKFKYNCWRKFRPLRHK